MPEPVKITRIPSLKSVDAFRALVDVLGIDLPCEDEIAGLNDSPLAQPLESTEINGKRIGNRIAIHPMEGWDGTTTGGVTDNMRRRWRRFGESGAKLIFGGEAMAVRPDGRANPNQLIIVEENRDGIEELVTILKQAHLEKYGSTDDLVIGFQLTHSGRFCKPNDKFKMEPRVAYRHPILDRKFNITSDDQVWTDDEIEELIQCYIRAAAVAREAGADFVDIKHCHGYLLHEFLSARIRPGRFGGSFENRTRILRDIVAGIRATGNPIDIGVRLSAFDFVPFKPDPDRAQPGRLGPGIPESFDRCLPYHYGFGVNPDNPTEYDLTETFQFADLCAELGVRVLNLSAGSPYYNPHIQRPAAYPPSDGYQPPEDPLVGVARQIGVVRQVRRHLARPKAADSKPQAPILIGSGYSYLQEYLPHVAQYVVRHGWTDMVGLGRVVLSYPDILADGMTSGKLTPKFICRTFSDCTTGPRNGIISGCFPLDEYYKGTPEAAQLKAIKKAKGA
jgi:2,4-dienoyl-CoA reductase-like NADH-dependent reductase (Old Yellow Enzyme family)